MFTSKKSRLNHRHRKPSVAVDNSFRRNGVVVSRSQRELAARQQSVTQRQFDKQRQFRQRLFRLRVVAATILLAGLVLVWRLQLSGSEIAIKQPYKVSAEQTKEYQQYINQKLAQHTIARQSWLLDEVGLQQAVSKRFPEVLSLTVQHKAPFSATARVSLLFRRPVFVWQDATKTKQYVDKTGILFAVNNDATVKSDELVLIEDQTGVALQTGSSVLTANLMRFIGQLYGQLPNAYDGESKSIERVIIPASTRQVDFKIDQLPYVIKLSSARGIDEQVGELSSLIKYLRSSSIEPQSYIDLRLPHKAYYK